MILRSDAGSRRACVCGMRLWDISKGWLMSLLSIALTILRMSSNLARIEYSLAQSHFPRNTHVITEVYIVCVRSMLFVKSKTKLCVLCSGARN